MIVRSAVKLMGDHRESSRQSSLTRGIKAIGIHLERRRVILIINIAETTVSVVVMATPMLRALVILMGALAILIPVLVPIQRTCLGTGYYFDVRYLYQSCRFQGHALSVRSHGRRIAYRALGHWHCPESHGRITRVCLNRLQPVLVLNSRVECVSNRRLHNIFLMCEWLHLQFPR